MTRDGRLARQDDNGNWVCLSCQEDIIDKKVIQHGYTGSDSVRYAIRRQQAKLDDRIRRHTQLEQLKRGARKRPHEH